MKGYEESFIKSDSGFTLVEVLIAISIIAAIAVIITSSWSGNLIRFKSSQVKVEAVELLQRKILEIESEYKNRVESLPTELQTGIFEDDERFKKYKWEWEVQDIEIPDISALVSVEGQDPLLIAVLENFRTYLNQSIKEVKVSVIYQNGKEKPYTFTVPFYLVNYDNQLSMGIGGLGEIPGLPGAPQGGGQTPQGGGIGL